MAAHVIGSGGKTIRSIVERTGVKIDVEDDGRDIIAAAQKAISIIPPSALRARSGFQR